MLPCSLCSPTLDSFTGSVGSVHPRGALPRAKILAMTRKISATLAAILVQRLDGLETLLNQLVQMQLAAVAAIPGAKAWPISLADALHAPPLLENVPPADTTWSQ